MTKDLVCFPRADFAHVRDVISVQGAFARGSDHALVVAKITYDLALDRVAKVKRRTRSRGISEHTRWRNAIL